jgi:protein-tyrosine-phosphatase
VVKPVKMTRRLLFVCRGNTCRSPMAEALARRILGVAVDVQSAGIDASDGTPATRDAIAVMSEKGLNIREHSSRRIDTVDVSAFDSVVAMCPDIAQSLRSRGVDPAQIIELDVPDPYGKGIERYRATADQIVIELQRILPAWGAKPETEQR